MVINIYQNKNQKEQKKLYEYVLSMRIHQGVLLTTPNGIYFLATAI